MITEITLTRSLTYYQINFNNNIVIIVTKFWLHCSFHFIFIGCATEIFK